MHTVSHVDHRECFYGALRVLPWRDAVRRLIAYLAIRWGNAWLDANANLLDGYLPPHWETMPHHELIAYLDLQGITPEHCILA